MTTAAPPASKPGDSSSALSGKAAWDPALWKYYCKHEYELDVADEPQAFPEQDALKQLNTEFAIRLRAIIGVYQAASKLNNLGPAPGDGGIRSAADQLKIYKRGRKLKDGAVGDKAEDYEVVGDVDTKAWVSWHELGVACDLREFVGNKVKQPQNTPMTKAFWSETTKAMGELGMIWGGYWPWDYGHVEWHPYLTSPDHVGTPGKAATDADMKYGYDWKVPADIFIWHGKSDDPASQQDMRVFHLVQKENWLCLEKERFIDQTGDKYWRGSWRTFDPPVRVIPLYSPVAHLYLNSRDDAQWNAVTTVTVDSYDEATQDGKKTSEGARVTGKAHLVSEIKIHDWQKTAIVAHEVSGYPTPKPDASIKKINPQAYKTAMDAYELAEAQRMQRRAEGMKRFGKVLKAATYDMEIKLEESREEKSKESVHSTGRRLNRDGYTDEWDNTASGVTPTGPVYMAFSWDRDNGTVGVASLDSLTDNDHPALEVRGAHCWDNGNCTLVSTKAPHSIKDMEHAPEWPAANPKPKPKSEKLPPGQFLRP